MSETIVASAHIAAHERLHALDAVRGFALLLGIVFHAAASFLVAPKQVWLVTDNDPSVALTVFFYVAHMFRMATFFLIAGFFARLLYHRRGERGFVRDRLRRIGLPLLAGWPILVAALAGCLIWGAWVTNGGKLPPPPPPDPHAPPLAFPLTHLWFLYVLLWFYASALAVRRIFERFDAQGRAGAYFDRVVRMIVRSPMGVTLIAVPTAVGLFAVPLWRAWFGIPTPDQSLLPNVAALIAFGSAFGFGWLLHRQTPLLKLLEARWLFHLLVAATATCGCLAYVGVTASVGFARHDAATLGYAAGYAIATWSWSFALIGLALRYLAGYSPWRRYLADSSYWLYMIHLPIVITLQIVVSQLPWPAWSKLTVILAIAFPVMLLSYRYWVRGTFIGAVLNGRRQPPAPAKLTETRRAVRMEGAS